MVNQGVGGSDRGDTPKEEILGFICNRTRAL